MNFIVIIGRLTHKPELKFTQNNTATCSFRVAVDRKFKDANGNKQTDFFNCVSWKSQAEYVSNYFEKGRLIYVQGELQCRKYTTQNGENRQSYEIIVSDILSLESSKNQEINTNTFEKTAPAPVQFTKAFKTNTNSIPDNLAEEFDPFAEE